VALTDEQGRRGPAATPETPTFEADVKPILADHCLPCHSDVLRHGGLVLDYDAFPEWDDPARGDKPHSAQDALANLIERRSRFAADRMLVVPGDPERSFLLDVLAEESPDPNVRRMPLKLDRLSDREIETVRRWIETGAPRS